MALGATAARSRKVVDGTIVGASFAAVVISMVVAPDLHGVMGALLALVALAIAVVDGRHFIIPNELSAAGLVLGLVNAAVQNPDLAFTAIATALLRGAVLALVFLGVRVGYRWLRQRDGIGLGDVKLAAVAGAWLDWITMPIAIELAAVAALAAYCSRQYFLGRSLRPTSRLPFGLFFAPAIWLGWLVETTMLAALLGTFVLNVAVSAGTV
jgi:leader peptidase (prepilin peptidase) / N-methyltransferase